MKITRVEFERIKGLKKIDLQQCSFCHEITILNLGWPAFNRLYCLTCQEEHMLCLELCYKVALNILDCQLYQEVSGTRLLRPVKPNKSYDKCACYLCGKELVGASKKSTIKNRNNPSFWGVESEFKILCLECLGKRYLKELSKSKRRTFNKYLQRGYE